MELLPCLVAIQAFQPAEGFLAVVAISGGAGGACSRYFVARQRDLVIRNRPGHIKARGISPYVYLLGWGVLQSPEHEGAVLLSGEYGVVTGLALLVLTVLEPDMTVVPKHYRPGGPHSRV